MRSLLSSRPLPSPLPLAPALALALVALLLLSPSCSGSKVIRNGGPPTRMLYEGFDASGRPVIHGWIWLDLILITDEDVPQPLDFGGTWSLRPIKNAEELGPQVGSGVLAGRFVEDQIIVDLNPDHADNNVILTGRLTITDGFQPDSSYEGTWVWETAAGPRSHGTFRAASP